MLLKAATAPAPGPSKAAAKLALAAAVYNRMDRMASDGPLRTDGPMASDAERGVLLRKKSQARAAPSLLARAPLPASPRRAASPL